MAAGVAQANECQWCTKAHSEVASGAYDDAAKVSAALANLDALSIPEPLRATLRMLQKLTRTHAVDANDMRAVLAAKFGQHGDLRQLLLATGERTIVELAPFDDPINRFWSRIASSGAGDNWLGVLLMELRATLRRGES